jgi:uncharacterized membrane protein YeaQ/YmgE (transglycosylase-associated protein family)
MIRSQRLPIELAVAPVLAQDRIRIDLDIATLLGYILIGLVVGLLARLLVPGRTSIGVIGTIVIGVIGAVIGGWLAGEVFRETEGIDWIASIVVAVVLVLLLQAASRRKPMWGRRRRL